MGKDVSKTTKKLLTKANSRMGYSPPAPSPNTTNLGKLPINSQELSAIRSLQAQYHSRATLKHCQSQNKAEK